MGGTADASRRKYDEYGFEIRDEPSDDVSEWQGVTVGGGRVTELFWENQGLSGTIPLGIGALSALRVLSLIGNELSVSIPPTIGALTSVEHLDLSSNPLSGVVPSTLSNLPTNLERKWLYDAKLAKLSNVSTSNLYDRRVVQDYLSTLWLPQALRFHLPRVRRPVKTKPLFLLSKFILRALLLMPSCS